MNGNAFACFGYGSLVNRQTLRTDYLACVPARLRGWRRHWQSRGTDVQLASGQQVALLSVHRHDEFEIDGMLILERIENLAVLDKREERYERVRIGRDDLVLPSAEIGIDLPDDLYVYVGRPQPQESEPSMLLQSYLDAVLVGFLNEFGEAGLDRFFATTVGFDRPLIVDRDAPRYPRAVKIAPEIAVEFDRRLAGAGVFRNGGNSA